MGKNNIPIIIIVGVLVAGAIGFFFFSGSSEPTNNTPQIQAGEYDTFAQCLYEKGMRMYGSVTCSFCARQRAQFGNSFHFIKEIECDPRNADNEAERCIGKNISHTPTWILEDASGEDVHRFEAGVIALSELGEVAGCPLVKDPLP